MMDFNPPPSYYDPPEARHGNGSVIPPECACSECHVYHMMADLFIDNALDMPLDYPCCVDELQDKIRFKELCKKHPRSYYEEITNYCEGCDEEKRRKR